MHYCFFAAQYLPTAGGVERYTFNLARCLIARGQAVTVVTSALPGLPEHETDANGIEIFRMPSWRLMGGRLPVIRQNAAFRRLAAQLWAQPIDFCFVNTYFYPLSLYAVRKAQKRGIRTLLLNHGSAWLMPGKGLVSAAGRVYEAWAARRAAHFCTEFYGVSQAACRWLGHFGISAKGVLSNAVDPAAVEATAAQGEPDWRARLGLAPGTPLVAFAGRLIPEKGVYPLLQALPLLQKKVPDAALVLAGGGQLLAEMQKAKVKGLYVPGTCAYPDTLALLRQADVYCLPTRYAEGFPTTFLEAAACRCPVVCTATAGTEEMFPAPEYGTVLKDDAPQTIADALAHVLCDSQMAQTQRTTAWNHLCRHFTWEAVTEQLIQIARKGPEK